MRRHHKTGGDPHERFKTYEPVLRSVPSNEIYVRVVRREGEDLFVEIKGEHVYTFTVDSMYEEVEVKPCKGCGCDMSGIQFAPFGKCPKCARSEKTLRFLFVVDPAGNTRLQFRRDDLVDIGQAVQFTMTQNELEQLVTIGAGLLGKEVLEKGVASPDPSKLPSWSQLSEIVNREVSQNPFNKFQGFNRFLSSLAVLTAYSSCLPSDARQHADRSIQYIMRRLEELALFHQFITEMRKYAGAIMRADTSAAMFHEITRFVHQLKETVGIDLWEDK
jgi:hypothetical protein